MAKSNKPKNKANVPVSKTPVKHNRLRKERITLSEDQRTKKNQDNYYKNQDKILANKARYRASIKSGEHVPVPRGPMKKKEALNLDPKSEEGKAEARRASKYKYYLKNKELINSKRDLERQEAAAKKQAETTQKAIEEWEKFKKENE